MDKLKLLKTHHTRFTRKDDKARPQLKYVNVLDGHAYMTDAHRMLRIENIGLEDGLYEPKTLKRVEGEPIGNLRKLMSSEQSFYAPNLDVKEMFQAADAFYAVSKVNSIGGLVKFCVPVGDSVLLTYEAISDIRGEWEISAEGANVSLERYFNPKYLVDAIHPFRGWAKTVTAFGVDSSTHPMVMSSGEVSVLLLPVRKY